MRWQISHVPEYETGDNASTEDGSVAVYSVTITFSSGVCLSRQMTDPEGNKENHCSIQSL